MSNTSAARADSLWNEQRSLTRRARQVWRMVPRGHKWALGSAAFLMTLASASAIAVPLLIGHLIDGVKGRTEQQAAGAVVFQFAAYCLGAIAVLVVLREGCRFPPLPRREHLHAHRKTSDRAHGLAPPSGRVDEPDPRKSGALLGRIFRSIDGYMRLL